MGVVTRSGTKVNTNGSLASDPEPPRRSARVKAAQILKEQRIVEALAQKKEILVAEQTRAAKRAEASKKAQITKRARAAEKVRFAEKPQATENARASEKSQVAETVANKQVVAAWKADYNEARALRRARQKEALAAKQGAKKFRKAVPAIDVVKKKKIEAERRSHAPLYMSYKQFLDHTECKNGGYLERKAAEREWKSFCRTTFTKWKPDPVVFSVILQNRRLLKALNEVVTGRTHGGETFDVERFWLEKHAARGSEVARYDINGKGVVKLTETKTVFVGSGPKIDLEAAKKMIDKGQVVAKKARHGPKRMKVDENEVTTERIQFREGEKAEVAIDVVPSQMRSKASTMTKSVVSSLDITRPNLADWGILH